MILDNRRTVIFDNKATFVWSNTVLWITIIIGVVILIAYTGLVYYYINTIPFKIATLKGAIVLAVTAMLLYAVSLIPTSVTWSEQGIHINKIIGNIFIPQSSIKSIEVIHYTQLKNPIRCFGSGGVGGYNGLFWNRDLKLFTMYVTNEKSELLLIQTSKKKYVISCDSATEVAEFFQTINQ